MRRTKRFKRWAVYRFTLVCLWLLNKIPRKAAQGLGAWLGLAAWSLLPKERHRTIRHLGLVYGDELSPPEKASIGCRFFINAGKNITDVLRFKEHFHEEIEPLVTIEGLEHYHRAFESGKGMIGITGHIGNFELMAARMRQEGFEIAVIGRELYDKRLDDLLVTNRSAVGLTNLPTTTSPRELLRWLKSNGALGVLIDTDSFRVRGEFINWFGRPAKTPIGPFILGLKAGAPFVPMACVRTADGGYHVIVREQINIPRTDNFETDARRVAEACVRQLEEIILQYPDQWIWVHNRWHNRPEQKTA